MKEGPKFNMKKGPSGRYKVSLIHERSQEQRLRRLPEAKEQRKAEDQNRLSMKSKERIMTPVSQDLQLLPYESTQFYFQDSRSSNTQDVKMHVAGP